MGTRAAFSRLVVVVIGLVVLAGCGPQLFEPLALDPGKIPAAVAINLADHPGWSDLTWHVAEQQDGHLMYAYTFRRTTPDGQALRWFAIGWEGLGGGGAAGIDPKQPFAGITGRSGPDADEAGNLSAVTIQVGGYCFDRRVTQVVARTTEGRQFTSPVRNGFWLIYCADPKPHPGLFAPPLEQWAEITGRNASGKVLYRMPQ